jgi:immune inhibitor A
MYRHGRVFIYLLILALISLVACRLPAFAPATLTPVASTQPPPTSTATPTGGVTPTPITTETDQQDFSPTPVAENIDIVTQLRTNRPPARDDLLLAQAYNGFDPTQLLPPTAVSAPLPLGSRDQFTILNTTSNTNSIVEAELLAVGDHAYFWFDTTAGNARPTAAELTRTAAEFDTIYEQVRASFGSEPSPGIDGDPRIHIFNASPLTICNVTETTAMQCGLLGYFSAQDGLPRLADPQSNEREMFVMNGRTFGSTTYLDVLAHEFRHMIEANYDDSDWDWVVEGSAMLAEDLIGYPNDGRNRANQFLNNPDQQLNRWSEGGTLTRYGQGYLLNRYLYDRLGPDLYREFAQHPADGLEAVTAVAEQPLGLTGEALWLDWLIALAIHEMPNAPEIYRLPNGINSVNPTDLTEDTALTGTTVFPYAADYYRLPGEGEVTLNFSGAPGVSLLPVFPASGAQMWLANRANFSHARLTRPLDLTQVSAATLTYDVYYDIETGYDFAYTAVSIDNGQTWQGLDAPNMQSANSSADPRGVALTPRFYSGQSNGWYAKKSI